MSDIGAKVYRMALNSSASHGGDDPKSLEGLLPILWLHSGEEVVRHSDYEIALNRILELEAQNALLLEDEKASPAIIAGYRDYNARLIEQVRVRGERMQDLWQWLTRPNHSMPGPTHIEWKWFDDNGKVRDD